MFMLFHSIIDNKKLLKVKRRNLLFIESNKTMFLMIRLFLGKKRELRTEKILNVEMKRLIEFSAYDKSRSRSILVLLYVISKIHEQNQSCFIYF